MDIQISEDSTVVVTGDQVSSDFMNGDVVILGLKDGVYYGLNPVGARIWDLIQQPTTVKALRETLLQEYEVDPETCTRELLGILNQMAEKGLIAVNASSAA